MSMEIDQEIRKRVSDELVEAGWRNAIGVDNFDGLVSRVVMMVMKAKFESLEDGAKVCDSLLKDGPGSPHYSIAASCIREIKVLYK